jgi:hypothetical protein
MILSLSVANAEIMDIGDSSINPINDYVDFPAHNATSNELEIIKQELKENKELGKSKSNEYEKPVTLNETKRNTAGYKARMKCLMSNKTAEECDKIHVKQKDLTSKAESGDKTKMGTKLNSTGEYNLSQETIDYLKTAEAEQDKNEAPKPGSKANIEYYNKKIKCLMEDNPSRECNIFFEKD